MQTNGLHHVTAISGPARRNLDFYSRVLGLRLVKKTVNFDDPGTYHLYFGDAGAAPGSILTFFPWEHATPGRLGVGETQETVFRVPEGAIGFWAHRFVERGVPHEAPVKRFGETVLSFRDPDGMRLALVGLPGVEAEPYWTEGGIGPESALRGFHSVSLLLADAAPTAAILTDVFGFAETAREDTLIRYAAPVLVYTAEEVWGTRYPDGGSVHLLEWPELPEAHADMHKWAQLRVLRQQVTEAIEPLRREKVLGSSLEAEVWVSYSHPGVDLQELFITAEVHQGETDKVERSAKHKCGRCWRHLPEVEEDGGLCSRCDKVVDSMDASA